MYLNVLEDRTLLASFLVNLPGDAGTSSGANSGDIRYVVNQLNLTGGASNSIAFNTAGTGPVITLTHGQLPINAAVTITGPGASQLTISGGEGVVNPVQIGGATVTQNLKPASRVFDIGSITVTITGLTIANGNASPFQSTTPGQQGGDILNSGTLKLTDDVITNGLAQGGGSGGTDAQGGGIFNTSAAFLTIDHTQLTKNHAFGAAGTDGSQFSPNGTAGGQGQGGGIYNLGNLTIQNNSTFMSNQAAGGQGGKGIDGFTGGSGGTDATGGNGGAGGAGQGGAVWNGVSTTSAVGTIGSITGATFDANEALGGAGGKGGNGLASAFGDLSGGDGGNGGDAGNAQGGGVFSASNSLNINTSLFHSNIAAGGNAGAAGNGGAGGNAPFDSNSSGGNGGNGGGGGLGGFGYGGGVFASAGPVQVQATPFNTNQALGGLGGLGGDGGAGGRGDGAGNGGQGGKAVPDVATTSKSSGGTGGSAWGGGIAVSSGGTSRVNIPLTVTGGSFTSNEALSGTGGSGGLGGDGGQGGPTGSGGSGGLGGDGGGHSSTWGGAISVRLVGDLTIQNSAFTSNSSVTGVGGTGGTGGRGGDAGPSGTGTGGDGGNGGQGGRGHGINSGNSNFSNTDAWGGAIANAFSANLHITGTPFTSNLAEVSQGASSGRGGDGGAGAHRVGGGNGGNGGAANFDAGSAWGGAIVNSMGGFGAFQGQNGLGNLTVDHSPFNQNQALVANGGPGGAGGNATDGGRGGDGGTGGDGGEAWGGAVTNDTTGDTSAPTSAQDSFSFSPFTGNRAIAGKAGAGGKGGSDTSTKGSGGNGGEGGAGLSSWGGALWNTPRQTNGPASLTFTNSPVSHNQALAGPGGRGGDGGAGGSQGVGGNGGQGGVEDSAWGGGVENSESNGGHSGTMTFTNSPVFGNITGTPGGGGRGGDGGAGGTGGTGGQGGFVDSVWGGGLYDAGMTLTLNNSPVTYNQAFGGPGGAGGNGGQGTTGKGGDGGKGGGGDSAWGGGIMVDSNLLLTLNSSDVSHNLLRATSYNVGGAGGHGATVGGKGGDGGTGSATAYGGGVSTFGPVAITNSHLDDNQAIGGNGANAGAPGSGGTGPGGKGNGSLGGGALGGGLFIESGRNGGASASTFIDSTASDNLARSGVNGAGTGKLGRANHADETSGGGIYSSGVSLSIEGSIIHMNDAARPASASPTGGGGGVFVTNGDLTIGSDEGGTPTQIICNTADGTGGGGGLLVGPSVTTVQISGTSQLPMDFFHNTATRGDGGGVNTGNATVTFDFVRVSENQALHGGGLFHPSGGSGGTDTLTNTAVVANVATTGIGPDLDGVFISGGGNYIGNNKDATFAPQAGDQVGTPTHPLRLPFFVPPCGPTPPPTVGGLGWYYGDATYYLGNGQFGYTFVLRNNSGRTITAPVTISMRLPPGVALEGAMCGQGPVIAMTSSSLTVDATLAPGQLMAVYLVFYDPFRLVLGHAWFGVSIGVV